MLSQRYILRSTALERHEEGRNKRQMIRRAKAVLKGTTNKTASVSGDAQGKLIWQAHTDASGALRIEEL
jgi:hypothetical protein